MRIGLNLLYLLPGQVGGTETYATELMRALSLDGKDSEFLVFLNAEATSFPVPEGPRFRKILCRVHASNRVKRYLFEQFLLPVLALKYHIDILHSLGYVGPVLTWQKHLITIHDANFVRLSHLMKPVKRWVYSLIAKLSAGTCNHVVTDSMFSKEELTECLGIPASKVSVVYLGAPQVVDASGETGPAPGFLVPGPYLLALGGGSPHKNIAAFVQAFASVKDRVPQTLVIAGRLTDSLGADPAIASLIECKKIVITGFLDDAQLDLAYRGAELFVFPTLYEGFGLPLLEAQAHGAPVLCSRVASLPELGGASVEYFDPHSVEGMAEALAALLTNHEKLKEMRQAGYQNIGRFTWARAAAQTDDIYRRLLA